VTPEILEFLKKIWWRVPAGGCHIEEGLGTQNTGEDRATDGNTGFGY